MKTKLAIPIALAILIVTLAVSPSIINVSADSKTINADKVVIKKGSDITINVAGQVGPQGPRGFNGSDSTVPGPQGPRGFNGSDSTVPGPAGRDGTNGTNGVDGKDGRDGTTLSNDTISAVNQVVNQSAVLNELYKAFLNGSLSSISVVATNNTNTTG